MNLKNEKGAITLIVLVSCMFYIASVVCVQLYTQSKQVSVDRQYKQTKENYEQSKEDMERRYNQLLGLEKIEVKFNTPEIDKAKKNILVNASFYVLDLNIKTIKYGWYYSQNRVTNPSVANITDWTFAEKADGTNVIRATKTYSAEEGYYYLCVVIDNQDYWMSTPINLAEL